MATPPVLSATVAAWWADDLAASHDENDPVPSWTDRENGLVLSQASSPSRPSFSAGAVNGRPGVVFDGTNDYLRRAGTLSTSSTGCVLAVVQIPTVDSSFQYVWGSSDEATINYWQGGGLQSMWRTIWRNDTSTRQYLSDYSAATGFAVVEWSSDGSELTLRVNGQVKSTTQSALAGTSLAADGVWFGTIPNRDSFAVGALARSSVGSFLAGAIGFLVVLDAPLSTADRADLYGWIAGEYHLLPGEPVLPGTLDPVALWWATDLQSTHDDGDPVSAWVDSIG